MTGQPIVVYSAASPQQAHLLRNLLEQEGIAARVVNDAIQIAGGELPLGWTAAARVVVSEEDATEARAIAESFDCRVAAGSEEAFEELDSLEEWKEWPICPACGHKRSARCPVCGATGTAFPVADVAETPTIDDVLLQCEDCDDVIRPQWFRDCAACGADFGSGIEVESRSEGSFAVGRNTWLAAAVLLGGAAAFVGYCVWLLRA
jgi:hypothetical protein